MPTDDESYLSANESLASSTNDSFTSITDSLGDILLRTFDKKAKGVLNVCHINAQSVPSHYHDLLEAFSNTNVHAILISETWLKPHLPSTTYSLPGFILIRNDRVDRRGGGVAIYLRSHVPYKILFSSSDTSASAEYLFLEICVKAAKIILGVIYCPPCIEYFSSLEPILESLGSQYSHHIIMGDFNTDLLASNSSRSYKFRQMIESVSLQIMPLNPTHHNLNGDDTWLDLILISNSSLVTSHGQYPAPGFSHHDLIFLNYNIKPPKPFHKILSMRNFRCLDVNALHRDASKISWDNMIAAPTVDEKVGLFNKIVHKLYDVHAPIRKIKLKRPPASWMTEDVRMAMRRRDRAFQNFRKERSEDNWSLFKAARNRCNQMVRNAKRRYIHGHISTCSSANIWKFLGTLGIGKQQHSVLSTTIGLDDINKFFTSSCTLSHQTKNLTLNYLARLPRPTIDSFNFSPVATDEIKKIITSLKSNAVGFDNISRLMVTTILDYLLPAISHIVNISFTSCVFPSDWRQAYIIPLPKIPVPSLPNHFRPISILPFLSKVLEACAHRQLSEFIHQNNLLSPLQSGFRPGHSTTTSLLKVTGDIREGMENAKVTVLVMVDFTNAFNNVSHEILLAMLSHLMISSEALEWFSSYLQGRQQAIRIDESISSWSKISAGVPQGGIISPLLFSIFINFLSCELQCSYHLYADDLQLYSHASLECVTEAVKKINRDLENIRNWSDRFGISVNPSKCQAIIIGSKRLRSRLDTSSLPPIIYNGTVITLSPSVKDLGLYLDTTLNWAAQVTHVSQRVTGTLRSLYRLKNFLPPQTKVLLVQTLVLPLLDYGDVCYFDLNADLLNKYDRLLNNCIRFIFNLRKYDHVSTYRALLSWLPIRQRRNLRALTTLYSILSSPSSPSYLTHYFQPLCSNHNRNLRSSNNLLLTCPSHTSNFVHSSFPIQSILLWNGLPSEIRMSTNRVAFKTRIKKLLLQNLADSSQI